MLSLGEEVRQDVGKKKGGHATLPAISSLEKNRASPTWRRQIRLLQSVPLVGAHVSQVQENKKGRRCS